MIVRRTARDFFANQDTKPEGILCVFRGLRSAELREKIRRSDDKDFLEVADN